MSAYYVNLVATNPKREDLRTPPVRVLVDAGSELSWLPAEALTAIGLTPRRQRVFRTADGKTIQRDVGYGILTAESFEITDEIVFAQPADCHLLGVRTLEGFGVTVDPLAHKLVATSTLACIYHPSNGFFGRPTSGGRRVTVKVQEMQATSKTAAVLPMTWTLQTAATAPKIFEHCVAAQESRA